MEGISKGLIEALAAQGSAYIFLAIALLALFYVSQQWGRSRQECIDLAQTLHEKRVAERSEALNLLHAGTEVNKHLTEAMTVRNETLTNLIAVITANNERIERMVSEGVQRLERIMIEGFQRVEQHHERRMAEALQTAETLHTLGKRRAASD